MRKTLLAVTTAFVFGLGVPVVHATGGCGHLTPPASPYAVLEPETVPQAAMAMETDEASPAEAARRHIHVRQHAPKPTPRPL
jgi:hypothetical protein